MGPHIASMKAVLCPVLGIAADSLGIKAKTNEGLGPVGEKQAIACYAVALIRYPD
jgi:2-C-methyl-D-erythritol 2,4-cyclodiphosphate synthase